MGYFIVLLVYAIFGRTHEQNTGASSVKRDTAAAPVGGQPRTQGTPAVPPMQQYQGTQGNTQGTQPGVQGPMNA